MNRHFRLVSLALAAVLSAVPSIAQESRFCIGGNLSHLSKAETKACRATLDDVRAASVRFHGPAAWHYIVVCDEASWKGLAEFSARDVSELELVSVDTDEEEHTTFFRAGRLSGKETVERQVATELAGLMLGTNDVVAVQKQVEIWLRENQKGNTAQAAM